MCEAKLVHHVRVRITERLTEALNRSAGRVPNGGGQEIQNTTARIRRATVFRRGAEALVADARGGQEKGKPLHRGRDVETKVHDFPKELAMIVPDYVSDPLVLI